MFNPSFFPRYTEFEPSVPVWCLTPREGRCFHRFFDTSPLSQSQRFLACLRLPSETSYPVPGQKAAVILVDLASGEEKIVAQTAGWETQLGANINWGASDDELFFNDVDEKSWAPVAVKLDLHTGKSERFGRGVYHVSPDGEWGICASLEKMRRTQFGYGVVIPEEKVPVNWELADDDGLFLTDLQTGQVKLLVSLRELLENHLPERDLPILRDYCFYGFHAKWAPTGDRLLFTVRGIPRARALGYEMSWPMLFAIFTMRPDGSEIVCATDFSFWNRAGHHINWSPDGSFLTMNHALHFDHLRLVRCDADGQNKRPLLLNTLGSGHPSLHPNGKNLLTDCYLGEPMTAGDGTVPLRWIDLENENEEQLVRIKIASPSPLNPLRIDPHPAWDKSWRFVAFNGAPDGTRRVFLADLSEKLAQTS